MPSLPSPPARTLSRLLTRHGPGLLFRGALIAAAVVVVIMIKPATIVSAGSQIITGTVYSNTGGTIPLTSTKVAVSLNGGPVAGTGTTDAGGQYTITGLTLTGGTVITLYISGAPQKAVTVTTGTNGASMTGETLINNALLIHYATGANLSSPITSAMLKAAVATNYANITAIYTMSSQNATLVSGKTLYVATGSLLSLGGTLTADYVHLDGSMIQGNNVMTVNKQYTQSGGTFTGGNAGITVGDANFRLGPAAVFNAGSQTITDDGAGTWTNSGSFVPGTSTVVWNSTNVHGNLTLYNLTLQNGGPIKVFSTVTVKHTFTDGDIISNAVHGTIAAQGDIIEQSTAVGSVGTSILINGTGAQLFSGYATRTRASMPKLTINKSSGTLTLSGSIAFGQAASFTYTQGTVIPGSSTVIFQDDSITGSLTLQNVILDTDNPSPQAITIDPSTILTVGGTLTMSNNQGAAMRINGGIIAAQGDVITDITASGATSTFQFTGSHNQSFSGSALPTGPVTVKKTGGTLTLSSNLALNGTNQTLTLTGGTLNLNGHNLTVPGAFTVQSGATLRLKGTETITNGSRTISKGSTIFYSPASSVTGLLLGNTNTSNFIFGGTGSTTLNAALTGATLTLSGGTLDVSTSNYPVTLSGSWIRSGGTFTDRNGTVTLNGGDQSMSGSTTFYNLTKTVSAAHTLTFAAGTTRTITNTLTLKGASGNKLKLRSSNTGTQWNINPQGTRSIQYLDVEDSNNTNATAIDASDGTNTNSGDNTNWTLAGSTTTTLTSSLNPSTFGSGVLLTGTVTPSTATGTVTFKDGSTTLGTATLGHGSGTFLTSTLSTGSHSLTAFYGGNAAFTSSTSNTVTQTVNKAASSTVVTSSLNPSTFGSGVTLKATVTPSTATGTVTFKDGSTTLGTATLGHGSGTYATSALSAGSHALTALYGGNVDYLTSTSATLTQTVNKAATSTALTSSVNPSATSQSVTFTATATPSSATGTLTFKDGAATLGTATLGHGSGSYTTSSLTAGSHSITAVYGGNTDYLTSTSSALVQSVKQSTTTTVTSSLNPSTFGSGVTLTGTVSPSTATGTLTFKDGSTTLGTATLGHGSGTYTTTLLSGGSHSLTAVYGGDSNDAGSTSNIVTQTVNKANTTTALTSSLNPSTAGGSVTFTATIAPTTATGTVTVKDSSTLLGSITLSHGSGTYSTSSLLTGSHSITAVYGGNVDYLTSTSATLTQTVLSSAGGIGTGDVLAFDGKTNYAEIPINPLFRPARSISTEAWVYSPSWSALPINENIVDNGEGDAGGYFLGVDSSNNLTFDVRINCTDSHNVFYTYVTAAASKASLAAGWHLLDGTYDGSGIKLYVDGALKSTFAITNGCVGSTIQYPYSTDFVRLGAGQQGAYAPVRLDEVRFYSGALLGTTITSHYNGGSGQYGTNEVNLIAGYHLDEGSSITMHDYSPHALNGYLVNTPRWLPRTIGATQIGAPAAVSVTSSAATIVWSTNAAATSKVDYGTTTGYGTTVSSGTLIIDHSLKLTGLSSNTIYHYKITSTPSGTGAITSSDLTFTTEYPAPTNNIFYVSSTGSSAGNGDIHNPWDLQTALNQPATVKPGATIYLRGGTYTLFNNGTLHLRSTLTGSSGSDITVMSAPNEWATIDCSLAWLSDDHLLRSTTGCLDAAGSYTTFKDFEITNSDTAYATKNLGSNTGSNPAQRPAGGLYDEGQYNIYADLVIHNTGEGIETNTSADAGSIIDDNIVYGNGWNADDRTHGHGIYIQNPNSPTKTVDGNLVFSTISPPVINLSGTSQSNARNISMSENFTANGGDFLGNNGPLDNFSFRKNMTYFSGVAAPADTTINHTATLSGNYIMGGANVGAFTGSLTFTNNTVWSLDEASLDGQTSTLLTTPTTLPAGSQYTIDYNTYYQSNTHPYYNQLATTSGATITNYAFGTGGTQATTYAHYPHLWQQNLGYDVHGTYIDYPLNTTTRSSDNRIFLRVNKYDTNQANLIIYNWTHQSAVTVPASVIGQFLNSGNTYALHGAQDYFNDIKTGTYGGTGITIDMQPQDHTVEIPNGFTGAVVRDVGMRSDGKFFPEVGVFRIVATRTSGGSPTFPNDMITYIPGSTPSTTTLTSSLNPSTYGSGVTLTGTVSPSTATGTVIFYDGSATLATLNMGHGSGSYTTSTLVSGTHSLTATYSGNATYAQSTSATVSQVVNQITTATTLTSSLNPASFGSGITLKATVSPSSSTGTVIFKDGSSIIGTVVLSHASGATTISTLAVGSHSLTAFFAGSTNYKTSTSSAVTQTVTKGNSSTMVSSDINPAATNQTVTFTATATPSSATGTVTFKDGSTALGTATLGHGSGTYATASLTAGVHSISAVYGGNVDYLTSTSATLTEHINAGLTSTTTILTTAPNPSTFGSGILLTGTVSPSAATGSVTFKNGITILGTVTLSHASGSITVSSLHAGSYLLSAVFTGSGDYAGSTGTHSQTVTKANASAAISSSLNPSTFGSGVTLTGTVTPASATGAVTFHDGTTVLGTVSISHGSGSVTTTAIAGGNRALTAVYNGNSNYLTATSATLTQIVHTATTTTTLGTNLNPATYTQSVTFIATVTPSSATGTLTFKDGSTTLGTATLGHGSGSYSTTALSVGSHTITAVYGGNEDYATSTSSAVTETVNRIGSSLNLTSSLNPSIYGVDVTFTGTVTPSTATGTVTFADGGTTLGTATLRSGSALFDTSTLAVGTHLITADYGGDTHDTTATSGTLTQTVTSAASSSGGGGGGGGTSGGGGGGASGGGGGTRGTSVLPLTTTASSSSASSGPSTAALSLNINNATVTFRDVPTTSWFAPFIAELVTKGIVSGYADKLGHPLGLFGPANAVTYAEVAKMAILGAGLTPTSAVPHNRSARDQWSASYIAEAESIPLSPYTLAVNVNRPMSRAEALDAVLQAFDIPMQPYKGVYQDVSAATSYAAAIATATNLGIVQGDTDTLGKPTGTFRPADPINRAEFSKILTEVMGLR